MSDETEVLKQELADLRDEVRALSGQVQNLVVLWKSAGTILSFVKWTASISSALVAVYLLLIGHYR